MNNTLQPCHHKAKCQVLWAARNCCIGISVRAGCHLISPTETQLTTGSNCSKKQSRGGHSTTSHSFDSHYWLSFTASWGARDGIVVRALTSHHCGIIIYYLFNSPTDNKKWSNGETTFSLVERAENSHWQAPQFRRYRPWRRRTHTYFSYVQCGLQVAIEGKITSNTLRDVNCMVWRSHFLHPMYPELLAKREVNTANIGHILCLYEPLD